MIHHNNHLIDETSVGHESNTACEVNRKPHPLIQLVMEVPCNECIPEMYGLKESELFLVVRDKKILCLLVVIQHHGMVFTANT